MVRKKLFLTLLILFVLMSAIGCGKTNGGGGTPEYSLSIAVNPEGSGQVITEPSGPRYKKGTTVSLTAAPNTGWAFHQWTGGITGTTNPTTIVMNANKTVTANFVISSSEHGTVTGIITKGRSGPPVAGATVTVLYNGDELGSVTTDAGGEYSLSVPAGNGVDLVASKDGLAGTRFQGITVAEGETFIANLIMQEWKIPGGSVFPPSVTITDISPGAVLSGTVFVDVELEGEFAARDVYISIGMEFSYHNVIREEPPHWYTLDTRLYPDGELYLYVIGYDQNNNCVITRIPVTIENHGDSGSMLTMTKPVHAMAMTAGDDMYLDALDRLGDSIMFREKRFVSRLQEHLSISAAEERSACLVELRWEPEFSTESGFKGYNVYRSSNPDGPWRWLGTALLDEYYEEYYYIYDATPQVTPGVPSHYKVVPVNANGVEGTGVTVGPVIPLGRFEVNLVTPEHNARDVALNPTLSWRHNGLDAEIFTYGLYLEDLSGDREAEIYLEMTDKSETVSVQYDSNWRDYFPLENSGKYQWDISFTEAVTIYDENIMAVSVGVKSNAAGSYNGAFVFTTEPADE